MSFIDPDPEKLYGHDQIQLCKQPFTVKSIDSGGFPK